MFDSMDGAGEHYAKGNKPVRETQIPYDLTYRWNLMNKGNSQTELTPRHREQTDDCQMRGGGGLGGSPEGIEKHRFCLGL